MRVLRGRVSPALTKLAIYKVYNRLVLLREVLVHVFRSFFEIPSLGLARGLRELE